MNDRTEAVKAYLLDLQDRICAALEVEDGGARFVEDAWTRPGGGGGRTRVIENGALIEKGGVNFSHVHGDSLPPSASAHRPELAGRSFEALGVSLVIHPHNPYVPTSHANVRFFIAEKDGEEPVWWFGGGFDLTPYYGFEDDCVHWHRVAGRLRTLRRRGLSALQVVRPLFPHQAPQRTARRWRTVLRRPEPVGFRHQLRLHACGRRCLSPGLSAHRAAAQGHPFGERERQFQLLRRGRYVEYNLVYDRGTLFGLQSGGRTESILMSLPPQVAWGYDKRPEPGSPEARLTEYFLRTATGWPPRPPERRRHPARGFGAGVDASRTGSAARI